MMYYIVFVLFLLSFWCPCMAINVSIQYNGGLLPDIILLTQCYLHRGTHINAMKKFCICSLFKSLSRIVTCTRELISIYMCYSQGDGINTSLSRLSYLVLYTGLQLSSCTLSLYGNKYPMYWTLM